MNHPFHPHKWQITANNELLHMAEETCIMCNMVRKETEQSMSYHIPARTPSGFKDAPKLDPEWPEPSCIPSLEALGKKLQERITFKEMEENDACCTSFTQGGVDYWECGGPGICDCGCHMEHEELVV